MAKENNSLVLLKSVRVKGLLQSKQVDGLAHFTDVGKKFGETATLCGIPTSHCSHTDEHINCKPCLHAALDLIMARNFTYQEEILEAAGIRDAVGKILGTKNKISNVYATLKALETISGIVEARRK